MGAKRSKGTDMNNQVYFPVGGSRDVVYDFLMRRGFIMSKWSDKCWLRADDVVLHLYGSGSKARITRFNKVLALNETLADDTLDAAIAKLGEAR